MTFLNLREFNDVFVFDISAGIENNKFDNLQYTKQNLNDLVCKITKDSKDDFALSFIDKDYNHLSILVMRRYDFNIYLSFDCNHEQFVELYDLFVESNMIHTYKDLELASGVVEKEEANCIFEDLSKAKESGNFDVFFRLRRGDKIL